MKKILVNYTGRLGGGPMYAWEMTKGLLENGAEVSAVVSRYVQNLEAWKQLPLKKLVVLDTYTNKYSFIRCMALFSFHGRKKIQREIGKESFDIVYCPMYTWLTHRINRMFRTAKTIVTIHDPIPHSGSSMLVNKTLNGFLLGLDIAKAHKVVILSRQFKEYMEKRYRKTDEDVLVIPHGVFSAYKKAAVDTEGMYDPDRINFLFFGRIEHYKGVGVLVDAYRRLERNHLDRVSLTIVGKGDFAPYQDAFNTLHQARLVNRWVGDDEVDGFFCGKNVVTVLPYLDATQSGVVNIAMQNHSLIIATNTGGLAEQLADGAYGLMISPDDVEALYDIMEKVVLHYEDYDDIRRDAYNSLKELDWRVLSSKILEACE